jgi:hypothetical protein
MLSFNVICLCTMPLQVVNALHQRIPATNSPLIETAISISLLFHFLCTLLEWAFSLIFCIKWQNLIIMWYTENKIRLVVILPLSVAEAYFNQLTYCLWIFIASPFHQLPAKFICYVCILKPGPWYSRPGPLHKMSDPTRPVVWGRYENVLKASDKVRINPCSWKVSFV